MDGGDKEDARVRAALLLAQMDRFFDLWVIRGLAFDRERALATLTDQWLSVLGAGAEGARPLKTVKLLARQLDCSLVTPYSQRTMGATAAIAGLGITEMGKVYGRTASDFAGEAIALALEDAGLEARDVDGLLINGNQSAEMAPPLQFSLGFVDLTLLSAMSAFGSTAGSMLQYAAHAIEAGRRTWWCACTPTRR